MTGPPGIYPGALGALREIVTRLLFICRTLRRIAALGKRRIRREGRRKSRNPQQRKMP
jgi:hypothetical protein